MPVVSKDPHPAQSTSAHAGIIRERALGCSEMNKYSKIKGHNGGSPILLHVQGVTELREHERTMNFCRLQKVDHHPEGIFK